MSDAYIHLLLNHVPLLSIFFGLCLLLYGLISGKGLIKNIAIIFFVVAAAVSIPVMQSGEGAEEMVEHVQGVSEATIEPHEEAAEIAAYGAGILGFVSFLYLILAAIRKRSYNAVPLTLFVVGIAAFILMVRTAQLGGKIMHHELSDKASTTQAKTNPNALGEPNTHDDDDD